MAVLPMKKMHLVAMKRDRKRILEVLQRQDIVQLSQPEHSDSVFKQVDHQRHIDGLQGQQKFVADAIDVLEDHSLEKKPMLSFLNGKEDKTVAEYENFEDKEHSLFKAARTICQKNAQINELYADRIRWEALKEELTPWINLTVPLNYKGSQGAVAFVGAITGEYTHREILNNLATVAPTLEARHLEVISMSKEQTCILLFGLPQQEHEMKNALDILDFHYPALSLNKIPKEYIQELNEKDKDGEEKIQTLSKEIDDFSQQKDEDTATTMKEELYFLADYYSIQVEKHIAIGNLSQSSHTFLLEGYLPEKNTTAIEKKLTQHFTCAVTFTEPKETPPVKLENNWFSEPIESVVTGFNYPGPGEVDPTGITSVFYYIMFGLMFSDAGYGIILASACAVLLMKFKNMPDNTNRFLRMFFWCGVSTVFWGVVFSSYFGNVVEAVTGTFFGNAWNIPPLWFTPMDNPMLLLVFCMGIGLVHLTAGYVMKGINCANQKDFSGILFDAGFPILFIMPVILMFMQTEIFSDMAGFAITLSPSMAAICKWVAIAASIGVVIFAGRDAKTIGGRIASGLYELYNMVAGWLSDILSYSRLLALGLATGIIGEVINTLGGMGGPTVMGVIVFILVFAFGHALNFGINILGAYVHSNRLEYVEFYGKFFDGGGRGFVPFGTNTKHYRIREDIENE